MNKLTKAILVATLALTAGCLSVPKVDNAPVAALDLNRYLGEWYEIARFDHSFERGVEQAKANYTQNADGTIKVVNTGIKNGKPKTAIGKGKTTGSARARRQTRPDSCASRSSARSTPTTA